MLGNHAYHKDEVEFGPDVDLATEELYDTKGTRIDQDYVDQAIADVHQYRTGRPPLGSTTGASLRVSFRGLFNG